VAGSLAVSARQSPVTVLISDIRGFTQLTVEIGPYRMSDLLNEYFPVLIHAIHTHHGTVGCLVGDSILAVFGSPDEDKQQHERAVRAALEMQATTSALMSSRAARRAPTCEIGIGIHCGEALHGLVGNAEWLDYTLVGDAANLASRYCNAAGKGEILISREVHARVFNKISCERTEVSTKDGRKLSAFRLKGMNPA
jgi:adenylate cyclase